MLFDLFLAFIFVGSATALWYYLSLKIPELVAVSDAVIVERFHEDSARIRIFLLHAKVFYREDRHWAWLWKATEKICHRIHIFLLRADNRIVGYLAKIRSRSGAGISASSADEPVAPPAPTREFWASLREGKPAEPEEVKKPARYAPSARALRIQEVRTKNS